MEYQNSDERPEYNTSDAFPDHKSKPLYKRWRFELPEGWRWWTSKANKPEKSWLYIAPPGDSAQDGWEFWVSRSVEDPEVVLMGHCNQDHFALGRTPEELREQFLVEAARLQLGINDDAA